MQDFYHQHTVQALGFIGISRLGVALGFRELGFRVISSLMVQGFRVPVCAASGLGLAA